MAQNDEIHLKGLYAEMYKAMIAKDTTLLGEMMADDSALIHMTGMRQPRREYLNAIADGTLNYYSCTDSEVTVNIEGDSARMTGCSRVNAAVFGGGRHTWPLQLDIDWRKEDNGKWKITEIRASTNAKFEKRLESKE
ncbi:MAG: nuclear transport factor 2 family protein [Muribaculaceae bacterium]|nr:nuclear transport factor 2 family protein [Muribaculaceae bacterium]